MESRPRHRRVVLALMLGITCAPVTMPLAAIEPPSADSDRLKSLVELSNRERRRAGLEPLQANYQLMKAAQTLADQAVALDTLAHVLPGARYPKPEDRLRAVGYSWRAFAENIAYGQRTTEAAVEAWMKSPGHRKNLLSPAYTELGTGYAVDASGRPYWVQVFGRPG